MVTRCPAWGHPDPWLNSQRLSLLLLLLLLPGPSPALGMEEDASFPHLGESSQPPPRACPPRCSCPRADTVDCDGLELRVFPDNITRAAQHLSLQNNQLQELPYNELSRLSDLRTLNLHNNLISSEGLPDEAFESLTQLQHIYVAHNRLSVAPQFLPRSLRVADLAANEVTEIFPLTFGEKPALRSVYLHNNQLSNAGLPPDAFRGSEAVATLSLSSNRLSYVPPSLPPSLERLHLQNNIISKVPRGALSRQTHLRELYLQHNQLTDSGLDATTFRCWTSATTSCPSCPPTCLKPWRNCTCRATASATWAPKPSSARLACVPSSSGPTGFT